MTNIGSATPGWLIGIFGAIGIGGIVKATRDIPAMNANS